MSYKILRTVRIALSIIAIITCCICVIVKTVSARKAEKAAATDISKISVMFTEKESRYGSSSNYYDTNYHIAYTMKITNNTKVDWAYLEITTKIYSKNNEFLGSISSTVGAKRDDYILKVGETAKSITEIEASRPDAFFKELYESELSDLIYKSEVTFGRYYED